jgi:hypothetical protein
VVAVLLVVGWTSASAEHRDGSYAGQPEGVEKGMLLREGTQIKDQHGHFEPAGDSADFVDESGRRLGGLKNLNMQRVTQVLRTSRVPEAIQWTVSGTITEFGGRNYLLITRVVRRSSADSFEGKREAAGQPKYPALSSG